MAKYTTLNEPVFVNSVREIDSIHGHTVFEVTFVGIKSKHKYTSWFDPGFNNFSKWKLIIDTAQTKGVVINNLKMKDAEKGIINADSTPTMEYVVTRQELIFLLNDFWDEQDNFKKLFGENREES